MPPNVPGSCCLLNTVHQSSASAATEISTLGNDRGEAGTASLTALQTLMSPGFALCSAPCWLHSHLHTAGSSRRERPQAGTLLQSWRGAGGAGC